MNIYFIFGALCPSKSGLMNKHIVKHSINTLGLDTHGHGHGHLHGEKYSATATSTLVCTGADVCASMEVMCDGGAKRKYGEDGLLSVSNLRIVKTYRESVELR